MSETLGRKSGRITDPKVIVEYGLREPGRGAMIYRSLAGGVAPRETNEWVQAIAYTHSLFSNNGCARAFGMGHRQERRSDSQPSG